jgi:signal peptidase I
LPAFTEVKRNDVVVFNFPAGDTIINLPQYGSAQPYYDVLRDEYKGDREALKANYPILVHPMDKTDNYIKRCVAVAGDLLEVKNAVLYINNQPAMIPPGSQTEYLVETNGTNFSDDFLNELGIDVNNVEKPTDQILPGGKQGTVIMNMTAEEAAKVKNKPMSYPLCHM